MDMAYASLTSLAQILDQIFWHIRNHLLYNRPQIESLREKVGFLQEFIEDCDQRRIKVSQDLENQIKKVAHRAEDVIETKMVDDILGISPRPLEGSTLFCQKIETLIQEFDSVKKMVVETKESQGMKYVQRSRKSYGTTSLSGRPAGGKISAVVGLEQHLVRVMEELTAQQPRRQVFPIVGMGGIGKTTLCRHVYENPLIVQHFHVSAWITVSQEFSVREIILRLLREIKEPLDEETDELRDDELGEKLHKSLSGRKYLIVMDDIWGVEVWDEVKMFLPDNGNGSRIMVTTRLSDVAHRLSSCSPYTMDFLDEYESWSLLYQTVFGDQETYPVEFEEVGQQIARNCRGLPLAIIVVGGLLSKSDMTGEYWEYVAQHLSSVVNSENDEHCLSMLYLSYQDLPVHLKPCFLYMGVFPEDGEILVSKLITLWVAEGFLKPIIGKSLEEVAEDYLQDLIDRNLVMVRTRKSSTKMRSCGIHDLLRDLCTKVAQKENFFWLIPAETVPGNYNWLQTDFDEAPRYVWGSQAYILQKIKRGISSLFGLKGGHRHRHRPRPSPPPIHSSTQTPYSGNIPSSIKDTRCLVIPKNFDTWQMYRRAKSASFTRSLFSGNLYLTGHLFYCFRLLRIVDEFNDYSPESIRKVVNSRYLACSFWKYHLDLSIPPSIELLRNLQTLVFKSNSSSYESSELIALPSEIWKMPHLRHIMIDEAILPDPPRTRVPNTDTRSHYLHNLQTLSTVRNFRCDNKNVLERIPNVKKLKINWKSGPSYCFHLNNLVHLQELESLNCKWSWKISLGNQAFPDSINKLTLKGRGLRWDQDMSIIGSLPNLEVLKLFGALDGEEWITLEGQFLKLKFLLLESSNMWRHWETESSHFPRLESLILRYCMKLEEIPYGIGEIPTLKLIELYMCGEEANSSAEQIQEEQLSMGNEDLQVRVEGSVNYLDNDLDELSKLKEYLREHPIKPSPVLGYASSNAQDSEWEHQLDSDEEEGISTGNNELFVFGLQPSP
ncbi:putative late blight resistance protein homolog R1A-3 [Henckelia pumila]|uniref:putative late blight resistance protein homolog R1A-3 n=1 Tax=Henckelia pumila TaxID=405737 RepID=UPI003C6E0DD9